MDKKVVSVQLDGATFVRLQHLADTTNQTISQALRAIIDAATKETK